MTLNLALVPSTKFLVAVSGGRDSLGLLNRLVEKREQLGEIFVAHINHRLRQASQEEAEFIRSMAERFQLPFFSKTLALKPKGETQARHLRYQALTEIAEENEISTIAVAHHRNDQLETRLLNLCRGASPQGLLGMPKKRELKPGVFLIRPALECDPEWLHQGVVEWREDPSNQIPDNPRNRLRLEIIPQLQTLFARDLRESFDSLASLLQRDHQSLESLTPQEAILSQEAFIRLPESVQSRWLRRFAPFDRRQIDRGLKAIREKKNLDLGHGIRLRLRQGTISLEKLDKIAS